MDPRPAEDPRTEPPVAAAGNNDQAGGPVSRRLLLAGAGAAVLAAASGGTVWALTAGVWKYDTRTQASDLNTPAVANGMVYFGALDSLQSVHASTGAAGWRFSTSDLSPFASSLATANGLVYAGCDDNNIYALRG